MLSDEAKEALGDYHDEVHASINHVLRAASWSEEDIENLPCVTLGSVPFRHMTKVDGLMRAFGTNCRRAQHPCCEYMPCAGPCAA